jgi:hypothetical protein
MSQMIQPSSACLMLLVLAQATAHAADESAGSRPDAEPAPLSVAPLDQIQYPEDRPEWIDAPTNLKQLPHSWTVVSGPSESSEQSLNELRLLRRASVETYLKTLPGADGRLDFFPLTDEWIEDRLVVKEYAGLVIQEGLTKHENAAELRIDSDAKREMLAALKNDTVGQRLGVLGVLTVTGLFGLIFSSALVGTFSRRVSRRESMKVSPL